MTIAIRPMSTSSLPSSPAAVRPAVGNRSFAGLLDTTGAPVDTHAEQALGFNALGMFGRNHAAALPVDDTVQAPATGMEHGWVAEPPAEGQAPADSTPPLREMEVSLQRATSVQLDAAGASVASRIRQSLASHTEQGIVSPFTLTEPGDGGTDPSAATSRSSPPRAAIPRPPMDARVTVHIDGQSAHVVVRAGALSEAEAKRLRDRIEDLLARGDLHLASLTLDGAFDGNTTRIMGERHGHFQR